LRALEATSQVRAIRRIRIFRSTVLVIEAAFGIPNSVLVIPAVTAGSLVDAR
jgi:hypothetical protein